jgi:hypothetical protein
MLGRWFEKKMGILLLMLFMVCQLTEVYVEANGSHKIPVKNRVNSGLSYTIPYVINSKGNKARYNMSMTRDLGTLMQSYSSGVMNNFDKKSQQYCLSRKHFIFLNKVSEKWIKGVYSKRKALKLASNTKFRKWKDEKEAAWSLADGTMKKYEVKSRNVEEILKYIGRTNFSSFAYVYTKCFYDKKTRITTVYLVNGRIF